MLAEDNNLAVKNPAIALQWDTAKNAPLTPNDVAAGSHKKVWWLCPNGHEWEARICHRTHGRGCPHCQREVRGEKRRKAAIKRSGSLAEKHPEIAQQWDLGKNSPLTAMDVAPKSQMKVWWKCEKAHEWQAVVSSRTNGRGCPHCYRQNRGEKSKKAAVRKSGSLAQKYPKIAEEWHPTKNGNLTPYDVAPRSHAKVWWKCRTNPDHVWLATLDHRTNGRGCPYCSGNKVGKDNNLAIRYPALAKQWHRAKNAPLSPYDITGKSNKKVWWICDTGHEWKTTAYHRSSGQNCPYCVGKKVTPHNNLAALHPDHAAEWHPTKNGELTPHDVTPGSGKLVWWTCRLGHEFRSPVHYKVIGSEKSRGCPHCSGLHPSDHNNLAAKYPGLAKEWHPTLNGGLTPYDVPPKSSKKAWWICKNGHSFHALISNRANGSGCPLCRPRISKLQIRLYCEMQHIFKDVFLGQRISNLEVDIYIPHYKLAIEVDGYPWHFGTEQTDRRKVIRLRKLNITLIRLREERLKRISSNDISYAYYEKETTIIQRVLKTLVASVPLEVIDTQRIHNYLSSAGFANEGKYKRLIAMLPAPPPGKTLADLYPKLLSEWDYQKNTPLEPYMFSPGSGRKVGWICQKGHTWDATVSGRTSGAGCRRCYREIQGLKRRQAALRKGGSLAEKYPKIAKQWHPIKNKFLTPYDVAPKSKEKVWWKCENGHEWRAWIFNRTSSGGGCRKCLRENGKESLAS